MPPLVCLARPVPRPLCPHREPSILGLALTRLLWSCLAVLHLAGSRGRLGRRGKLFIHPFHVSQRLLSAARPSAKNWAAVPGLTARGRADSTKNPSQRHGCRLSAGVQGRAGPGLTAAGRGRTQEEWLGRTGAEPTQSSADRLKGFGCYSERNREPWVAVSREGPGSASAACCCGDRQ